ncbi:MAG: zinc D-Ala-D-Ala carboxypeptidase [Chloroflexota bacterium]|jgi:D-alanyl-D-alanine carboxypeptidase|nr:zinc D-Ala-D-Ala carboxypeptidase [Chloroflexota bacterium]
MRHLGWRRFRAVAAALALAGGMLIGPLAGASPALGIGPLPACQIGDLPANPGPNDDWATTLLDWSFTVGPDYKPADLVSVHKGNLGGGGLVRQVAIDGLKALTAAAKAHGTPLEAYAAYRSFATQTKLFNEGVKAYGYDAAVTYWGRPGHSEHELGLTIDFIAVGDTRISSGFESTRAGGWMAKNAWKYGWLMSYPKGKQSVVCLHYEPWHYRYYGVDLAKKIHDSGLTPREYLWAHFTQYNTDLSPLATSRPSLAPAPTASVTPAPTILIEPTISTGATLSGQPQPTPPAATNAASGAPDASQVFGIVLIALAAIGWIASVRYLQRRQRLRRR